MCYLILPYSYLVCVDVDPVGLFSWHYIGILQQLKYKNIKEEDRQDWELFALFLCGVCSEKESD